MKVDVVSVVVLLFCFLAAVGVGAYAQDEDYVENKSLLELSSAVLAGGLPEGWQIRVGETGNTDTAGLWEVAADGTAVVLTPGAEAVTLVSPTVALEASCSAISGAVLGAGGNEVEARLQWMAGDAVVATVPLREPPMSSTENRRFNLPESARPETANAVQILLAVAPADNAAFRCASIRLSGTFSEKRVVSLFCNRIGYDQMGTKRFTAYSNFSARTATFVVSDVTGVPVYNGELTTATRIQGADGTEWDGYYYRGDFSALEKEGEYTITITLDDEAPVSVPIQMGFNLLWQKAFAPTLAPFKRLRVDSDPAAATLQLWETAFVGDTTEPALLWDLARSRSILQGRFSEDAAFVPLQEEVSYGLDKVAHRVVALGYAAENDLVGQTFYAASLACNAQYYPEGSVIREAAQLLADDLIRQNLKGILPFSTVMDMFEATQDRKYLDYAQQILPGVSMHRVEPLLAYEEYQYVGASIEINNLFNGVAERILKQADNPFGIAHSVTEGQRGFFLWQSDAATPLRGSSPRVLAAAEIMAQAYRYTSSPDKRDFVYDQLNWILGNNPFDMCLIAGLCDSKSPPAVLPEGMTAADVQGFVLHGIGPRNANEDYPCFATAADKVNENTNGFSLYNNARYISAMAYLKRIPVARPL
jgi:hypothetical protein